MYQNLEKPWKLAFELAITSLLEGSIPIGAVVVDENDNVVSRGRNKLFEKHHEKNQITNHPLAHAEMNAILQIENLYNQKEHTYHIYTTMEPCPLCFGAVLMSDIYHIHYAAKDPWAGSTDLSNQYVTFKNIQIEGPVLDLEYIQLALQTYYELNKRQENAVVKRFEAYNKKSVQVARMLIHDETFKKLIAQKDSAETIYNHVYKLISKL
jgi:tRNA(adenine34) deaminase